MSVTELARALPDTTSNHFRFMDLPPELRLQVYRHLLFAVQGIHLWCLAYREPTCPDPRHHPNICTTVLKLCRQITDEALSVLYGENTFVFLEYDIDRGTPQLHFPEATLLRIRKLRVVHPCGLNPYPPPDGRMPLAPWPAEPPNSPDIWRSVLANLNSLTLVLSVPCAGITAEEAAEEVARHAANYQAGATAAKAVMNFYQSGVPPSVAVHRRVLCHFNVCPSRSFETVGGKCEALHRYIEKIWLGE
ncbi:hypothetical protein C8A01DRAFT_40155 [Parachaetomium inaequale]|uniref:Uncharacterized protein n=1 Tax=Parachaetomium inaequale TaxID=2588326 RepID=A0AAN6PBK7_9PEZI|nr:hypothetical protein C8A01DRAFT_40155 [Parachaetomium inaequale]